MTDVVPEKYRFGCNADGTPALRCGLLLSQAQSEELNAWFEDRCKHLKENKWKGWNVGDMALRTICVQIDAYSKRAFKTKGSQ